jgi:tripartite-type tricarboxylate transporter receptor subunit TctC
MKNSLVIVTAFLLHFTLGFNCRAQSTAADNYPTQTIKIITNVGVGGTYDIFMRAIGDEMQKTLGKPVVVEPRPGGNFLIAGRACAESAGDGHTICALTGETMVYGELLFKKLPFDPRKDLAPVSNLLFNTQLLVVSASLGVKSLEDLARVAKERPKSLAYMSPGIVQRNYLEEFNRRHGTDMVSVPFKGGGDAVANMLNGTTPIIFLGGANFVPYIADGTVVGLAVDGRQRSPLFPEVPTIYELGQTTTLPRNWLGLFVPAATPRRIIDRLHGAVATIMAEPGFRQRNLIARGLEPIGDTPEEFARYLEQDRIDCARAVEEAGLKPQ